jgi:hypothetical protein
VKAVPNNGGTGPFNALTNYVRLGVDHVRLGDVFKTLLSPAAIGVWVWWNRTLFTNHVILGVVL